MDEGSQGVKTAYINEDIREAPELAYPTVDLVVPTVMKTKDPFKPHYIFCIDISKMSLELGFSAYMLNSAVNCLDYLENKDNTLITFVVFNESNVFFLYFSKSEAINMGFEVKSNSRRSERPFLSSIS